MKGQLIHWELKKLCAVPMFWIFIALSIGFNSILILSDRYGSDYVSYVAQVTDEIGGQMGEVFDNELAQLPDAQYKDVLIASTYGATDIFEDYRTIGIADYYRSAFMITGNAAELLERKFDSLQSSVDELAESGASLSLAAGGMTQSVYESLFHTLCRAILVEGMILAVLMALYSCGCEGLFRTSSNVYSSRTGRSIQKSKLTASAITSLIAYAAVASTSVGIFALVWRLGPIWDASMSSQFYTVNVSGVSTAFLSWTEFSAAGYLASVLLLGVVVVLVFHLIGFAAGMLTGNMYYGFLLFFLLLAFEFGLLMLFGDTGSWLLYQLSYWTPVPLWMGLNLWFTGLGISTIVQYQECWTALLWLVILGLLIFALYRRFMRKDVTEHAA